jgi:hypothetical protein
MYLIDYVMLAVSLDFGIETMAGNYIFQIFQKGY